VAELAAAVTDTHALLYHAAGGARLGPRAARHLAACERREAIVWIPAIVMVEVSVLTRGGLNLRTTVRQFFERVFTNPAFQPLPTTADQALDADELRFTRDPFDASIVAAARDVSLPLLTRDLTITESGLVSTIW